MKIKNTPKKCKQINVIRKTFISFAYSSFYFYNYYSVKFSRIGREIFPPSPGSSGKQKCNFQIKKKIERNLIKQKQHGLD